MNSIFRERTHDLYKASEKFQKFYIKRVVKKHLYKYYLQSADKHETLLIAKHHKLHKYFTIYSNDIELGRIRYNRSCTEYKLYKQHILCGIYLSKNKEIEFNISKDGIPFNLLSMFAYTTEKSNNANVKSKKNRKVFHKNSLLFNLEKIDINRYKMEMDYPMSIMQSFALSLTIMHKYGSLL